MRLEIADVEPGSYLVLLAVARWSGLRPSSELWAASVSLASGDVAPESVGSGLLAALAEAHLVDFTPYAGDLGLALERTERLLLHRLAAEEARRRTENAALAEIRRISLEETHARKVEQIRQRISTLQSSGKTTTIHLHEAQLRVQDRLLAEKESELRAMSAGMMTVEHLAVCTVEVVAAR